MITPAPFLACNLAPDISQSSWQYMQLLRMIIRNKTRQGYVRKHILKPAGYFFARSKIAVQNCLEGSL